MTSIARLLTAAICAAALLASAPSEEGIVFGEAGGETLTMDYYAPEGLGPHPAAIIIHGGGFVRGTSKNNSEAYCADFLAPAGYAVFSINYRLAPKHAYPAMLEDTQRAIRFIRHNAKRWNADPNRIALVGGSAGGFLSNMAGLLGAGGVAGAPDPVDRESARVQAVVTLFARSDYRGQPFSEGARVLFAPLIERKGEQAAKEEVSPIRRITSKAPPFLLIHGVKDETVPFEQSVVFQKALQAAGISCELILIPNGIHATGTWHKSADVPEWERRMTQWLNQTLRHKGPAGKGIRTRATRADK